LTTYKKLSAVFMRPVLLSSMDLPENLGAFTAFFVKDPFGGLLNILVHE